MLAVRGAVAAAPVSLTAGPRRRVKHRTSPVLLLVMIANLGIYAAMAAATGTLSWDAEELLSWGGNLARLIHQHGRDSLAGVA